MFFVIDKSKIFSYVIAICTVVILFVAAAGLNNISADNSVMTSTNVVNANEYTFIPNAIDIDKFLFNESTRNAIRTKYSLENKHVIGHVGRFMRQKNHKFLLTLFKEILKQDTSIVLVLLGDGQLLDEMREYSKTIGIENHVIFVGNVSNANEWYSAFDLFILPSIWEGLPVVGVEAQTAGLPCIFSDSITREIALSDNVEFISLHEDKNKWVNAVLKKINNIGFRGDTTELITAAHYNIHIEAKRLEDLYLNYYNGIEQ